MNAITRGGDYEVQKLSPQTKLFAVLTNAYSNQWADDVELNHEINDILKSLALKENFIFETRVKCMRDFLVVDWIEEQIKVPDNDKNSFHEFLWANMYEDWYFGVYEQTKMVFYVPSTWWFMPLSREMTKEILTALSWSADQIPLNTGSTFPYAFDQKWVDNLSSLYTSTAISTFIDNSGGTVNLSELVDEKSNFLDLQKRYASRAAEICTSWNPVYSEFNSPWPDQELIKSKNELRDILVNKYPIFVSPFFQKDEDMAMKFEKKEKFPYIPWLNQDLINMIIFSPWEAVDIAIDQRIVSCNWKCIPYVTDSWDITLLNPIEFKELVLDNLVPWV